MSTAKSHYYVIIIIFLVVMSFINVSNTYPYISRLEEVLLTV